jgi:hypothetical protein
LGCSRGIKKRAKIRDALNEIIADVARLTECLLDTV